MRIRVTKSDIKKGIPGNVCACPIAQAISRVLQGTPRISPGIEGRTDPSKLYVNNISISLKLSRAARRAIRKFDKTGKMKPFTFELHIGD